jgi:hypothetical protein
VQWIGLTDMPTTSDPGRSAGAACMQRTDAAQPGLLLDEPIAARAPGRGGTSGAASTIAVRGRLSRASRWRPTDKPLEAHSAHRREREPLVVGLFEALRVDPIDLAGALELTPNPDAEAIHRVCRWLRDWRERARRNDTVQLSELRVTVRSIGSALAAVHNHDPVNSPGLSNRAGRSEARS